MDENIKALLEALRDCQYSRDNWKQSSEYWHKQYDELLAEHNAITEAFRNKPNGSDA